MKRFIPFACTLLVAVMTMNAQQKEFPKLTCQYLSQKPPGMVSERLAGNVITDNSYPHSKMMISPNRKRIYCPTFLDTMKSEFALCYSDFDDRTLSKPSRVTSISEYGVYSFIFSADGEAIYIGSQQPLPEYAGKKNLWRRYSNKTNAGWIEPQPIKNTLDSNWADAGSLSMNNSGDLYLIGRYRGGSPKIYCSRSINSNYQKTEQLPKIVNTEDAQNF